MNKSLNRFLFAIVLLVAFFSPVSAEVTTHPRIWINSTTLPQYQSWATASNPVYQSMLGMINSEKALADAAWDWNSCTQNGGWRDSGELNGYEPYGYVTEIVANEFALMSLIDPGGQTARDEWGKRSRCLILWIANNANKPTGSGAPFTDPEIATHNRANADLSLVPVSVDWLQNSGHSYLSSADLSIIRQAFLKWGDQAAKVPTRAGTSYSNLGVINNPIILGSDPSLSGYNLQEAQLQARWGVNNYDLGHMRMEAFIGLSMDVANDPAVNSSKSRDALGNSLHSYLIDAIGSRLYRAYALFEPRSKVESTLGVPSGNISIGLASGGSPVEGFLYGESLGFVNQTLLALYTAGYTDQVMYGPQVGFLDSPYWQTKFPAFFYNSISPTAITSPLVPYLGPIYKVQNYGDTLRNWVTPDYAVPFASKAIYDRMKGNLSQIPTDTWPIVNVLEGGQDKMSYRLSNSSYGYIPIVLTFLAMDPNSNAGTTDPRPSISNYFYDPAISAIHARTNWSPDASIFDYRCSWEYINHELGDCMQFEFMRKGEWLTKQWSGYSNDGKSWLPEYANSLAIQNTRSDGGAPDPNDVLTYTPAIYGGQFTNGVSIGDPTTYASLNSNYAYAASDATNLYNQGEGWDSTKYYLDVLHASRSVVWLQPDHIIVYDRATTGKSGKFKRFNLTLTAFPSISGKTATVITSGGQKLTVQNLLPVNATLYEKHAWTSDPTQEFNMVAQAEEAKSRLIIEDKNNPSDVRFLNVLQGSDSGVSADPVILIRSMAGTPYDGVIVKNTAVMFQTNWNGAFSTMAYTVPSSVNAHIITGLTPNASYGVNITNNGNQSNVVVSVGGSYTADAGGVVSVGFPTVSTQGGVQQGRVWLSSNGLAPVLAPTPSYNPNPNPTPTPTPSVTPTSQPTPTPTIRPSTTPTPTPTPTATPTPSNPFYIGQRIQTTANLNVRASASATATILGTQQIGSFGTVVGGPVNQGGFNWWQVNYDIGADGWSVEDYIAASYTPPTITPTPTIISTPTPTVISCVPPPVAQGCTATLVNPLNCQYSVSCPTPTPTPTFTPTPTPTVTPTPPTIPTSTPTRIPTPTPSIIYGNNKFIIGSRIYASDNVNVRNSVGVNGQLIGSETYGSLGTVVSGPINMDDYVWWQVKFDDTLLGWSAENFMEIHIENNGSTPTPTPTIISTPTPPLKFIIGDTVKTTVYLSVRSSPAGRYIGSQAPGSTGTIVDGPIYRNGAQWWKIDYSTGRDGWSSQRYLSR